MLERVIDKDDDRRKSTSPSDDEPVAKVRRTTRHGKGKNNWKVIYYEVIIIL
jgi:hypothetical protein